jgi:putative sugar O-methyltransferase
VNISNFKSSDINFKLALWDPRRNGVRYLKTLIYNLAAVLGEDNWDRMRNIRNRDVGNPICVRYDGELVCLDYLQAVFELEFISRHVSMAGAHVLEIGAGYGRTCHAFLSNHDIATYTVIDLENSLALASEYLRTVLSAEQFTKISFVSAADAEKDISGGRFDLCINIDSFAEMTPETVTEYLALIDGHCGAFYVNNPVGKYLDKSLDGHWQGNELVESALSTGLLREIIDIHDNQAVREQVGKFTDAYRPGPRWDCVADAAAVPWSYYWQALYRRQ